VNARAVKVHFRVILRLEGLGTDSRRILQQNFLTVIVFNVIAFFLNAHSNNYVDDYLFLNYFIAYSQPSSKLPFAHLQILRFIPVCLGTPAENRWSRERKQKKKANKA
jgi:hypothetical protein